MAIHGQSTDIYGLCMDIKDTINFLLFSLGDRTGSVMWCLPKRPPSLMWCPWLKTSFWNIAKPNPWQTKNQTRDNEDQQQALLFLLFLLSWYGFVFAILSTNLTAHNFQWNQNCATLTSVFANVSETALHDITPHTKCNIPHSRYVYVQKMIDAIDLF